MAGNDILRRRRLVSVVVVIVGLLTLSGSIWQGRTLPQVRPGTGSRYEVSQRAGEAVLSLQAMTSRSEDAWLFLDGWWTDVGYAERRKAVQIDSAFLMEELRRQLIRWKDRPDGKRFAPVLYHIHPYSRSAWAVEPPSIEDIEALALLKRECTALTGVKLTGAVIDGRGKWAFDLTPGLEAKITNHGHQVTTAESRGFAEIHGYGFIRSPQSAATFYLQYPPLSWEAFLPGGPHSRNERIAAFIKGARELGVLVTYKRFRPIAAKLFN